MKSLRLIFASILITLLVSNTSLAKDPYYGIVGETYWNSPNVTIDAFGSFDDWVILNEAVDGLNVGTYRITIEYRRIYPLTATNQFYNNTYTGDSLEVANLYSSGDLDGDGSSHDYFGYSLVGITRLDRLIASIPKDVEILVRLKVFHPTPSDSDLATTWLAQNQFTSQGQLTAKSPSVSPADQFNRNYKKYVYFLVDRYKGRIRSWELNNEPDREISASTYLTYFLRSGYEAAKLADPSITILNGGLASTSGGFLGTSGNDSFLVNLLQAGGGSYFDVLSMHPYYSWSDKGSNYDHDTTGPFMQTYGGLPNGQAKINWYRPWEEAEPLPTQWFGNWNWRNIPGTTVWSDLVAGDFPDDDFATGEKPTRQKLEDVNLNLPIWFTEFGELLTFPGTVSGHPNPLKPSRWDIMRIFEEGIESGYTNDGDHPLSRIMWWSLRDLPANSLAIPEAWEYATYSMPSGLITTPIIGIYHWEKEIQSTPYLSTDLTINKKKNLWYVLRNLIWEAGAHSSIYDDFSFTDFDYSAGYEFWEKASSDAYNPWDYSAYLWPDTQTTSGTIRQINESLEFRPPSGNSTRCAITTKKPVYTNASESMNSVRFHYKDFFSASEGTKVHAIVSIADSYIFNDLRQTTEGGYLLYLWDSTELSGSFDGWVYVVLRYKEDGISGDGTLLFQGWINENPSGNHHSIDFRFNEIGEYELHVDDALASSGTTSSTVVQDKFYVRFGSEKGASENLSYSVFDSIAIANKLIWDSDTIESWNPVDSASNPAPILPQIFADTFDNSYWDNPGGNFSFNSGKWLNHGISTDTINQESGKLELIPEQVNYTWKATTIATNRLMSCDPNSNTTLEIDLEALLDNGSDINLLVIDEIPTSRPDSYSKNKGFQFKAFNWYGSVIFKILTGSDDSTAVYTSSSIPYTGESLQVNLKYDNTTGTVDINVSGGASLVTTVTGAVQATDRFTSNYFAVSISAWSYLSGGIDLDSVEINGMP